MNITLRSTRLLALFALLGAAALACGLPGSTPPTAIQPPSQTAAPQTPDLTLTAMFAVLETPPTAATPSPATISSPTVAPPVFTATTAPSNTPQPTFSPTATFTPLPTVQTRTAAAIRAVRLSSPPMFDGYLGEWAALTAYPLGNVVYGVEKWDGAADLSAVAYVGWDDTYLYLAFRVTDEDYEQHAHGEELFLGDSLEVLLDTKLAEDFLVNKLSPDDFQLGFSPGAPTLEDDPEAYLWFPASIKGRRTTLLSAARERDGGYDVELAIPWSVFEIMPQAGGHYGFGLSVSDNDIDGGRAQQTMISNLPRRSLTNPMTWGDLELARP